jgi:hypothetical protein
MVWVVHCLNHSFMFRVLLSGLLFACAAQSATLQQLSLDQMSQSATAIVRARVTGSTASFTGPTIYTHYSLQVTESWKGFTPNEVMVPGGIANGRRQSFPGVPELNVGTEYVMFLWTSSQTGITHLVGLSQGLFNVAPDQNGSAIASRPPIGEMILDSAGRRVADHAVSMPLTAMRNQVSHALVAKGAAK